jgi:hypothetical protein
MNYKNKTQPRERTTGNKIIITSITSVTAVVLITAIADHDADNNHFALVPVKIGFFSS